MLRKACMLTPALVGWVGSCAGRPKYIQSRANSANGVHRIRINWQRPPCAVRAHVVLVAQRLNQRACRNACLPTLPLVGWVGSCAGGNKRNDIPCRIQVQAERPVGGTGGDAVNFFIAAMRLSQRKVPERLLSLPSAGRPGHFQRSEAWEWNAHPNYVGNL